MQGKHDSPEQASGDGRGEVEAGLLDDSALEEVAGGGSLDRLIESLRPGPTIYVPSPTIDPGTGSVDQ